MRWLKRVDRGEWNPIMGVYTRGGRDDVMYLSYLRSGCFDWRLEKPDCPSGQTAIIENGKYVCSISSEDSNVSREASIRRTGAVRRILR